MDSRATQATRGVVSAAVATFVALVSHVGAGADMPGMVGIIVPFVLSIFVSVAVIGRRLSLIRLSAVVVLSQFLFHSLFALGTPIGSPLHGLTGHAGHDPVAVSAALAGMTPDASLLHSSDTMLLAHGLAVVVTVAALHRGESAVRALIVLAVRTVVRISVVANLAAAPVPRSVRAPLEPHAANDAGRLAWVTTSRRGPPLVLSA